MKKIKNQNLRLFILTISLWLVSFSVYSVEWLLVRDIKNGKVFVDVDTENIIDNTIIAPTINSYIDAQTINGKEFLSIKYFTAYDCSTHKLVNYNDEVIWYSGYSAKGDVVWSKSNPEWLSNMHEENKPYILTRLNVICELRGMLEFQGDIK